MKDLRTFQCTRCHGFVQATKSGKGAPWILREHTTTVPNPWSGCIRAYICPGSGRRP